MGKMKTHLRIESLQAVLGPVLFSGFGLIPSLVPGPLWCQEAVGESAWSQRAVGPSVNCLAALRQCAGSCCSLAPCWTKEQQGNQCCCSLAPDRFPYCSMALCWILQCSLAPFRAKEQWIQCRTTPGHNTWQRWGSCRWQGCSKGPGAGRREAGIRMEAQEKRGGKVLWGQSFGVRLPLPTLSHCLPPLSCPPCHIDEGEMNFKQSSNN